MNQHDWIYLVVNQFYAKAKYDVLIGYHFRNIQDFDSHIPRIASFWDLQLLGKTHRKLTHPFDVIEVHRQLMIKRGELGRWLLLLKKTIEEESSQEEHKKLKDAWFEKLQLFEGIFLRSFGL